MRQDLANPTAIRWHGANIYGVSGCVAYSLRRVTKITEWQSEQKDRVCWVVSLLTHRQRIQVFEPLESPTHHQLAIVDEDARSELAALPIDGRSDPRDV